MPKIFIKRISNRFPKLERYISVLFILLFTMPPIFLIAFGGEIGGYTGLAIYGILGTYTMYEVFKHLDMSKYSAIYIGLTIWILLFLPWTSFGVKDIIEIPNSLTLSQIFPILFSWKVIVIFFASTLLPVIFDGKLRKSDNLIQNILIIIIVSFIIGFFVKAVWTINYINWIWVFFFIPISIIADSFGFFGGMLFGKKWFKGAKLAPKLSPKKTWAGFIIGYVFSSLFIGLAGWYMHIFENTSSELAFLIVATIFIPIVSPIGDLLFSGIKRILSIKDFSNIFPGHGGAADRVDAMATVVFVFVILFMLF